MSKAQSTLFLGLELLEVERVAEQVVVALGWELERQEVGTLVVHEDAASTSVSKPIFRVAALESAAAYWRRPPTLAQPALRDANYPSPNPLDTKGGRRRPRVPNQWHRLPRESAPPSSSRALGFAIA